MTGTPVSVYKRHMTEKQSEPRTEDTDTSPEGVEPDVQSDPSVDDDSSDWSDEGGATEDGPAAAD